MVIVQGRLFLLENRSVVLLMISFRKLTALPLVCLGSLLFHLGDGVHFLGDELFELTFLDSAWCLVRIALKLIRFREPSYIGLKSGAGYSSSQLQQLQGFQNSRNLHRLLRMLVG